MENHNKIKNEMITSWEMKDRIKNNRKPAFIIKSKFFPDLNTSIGGFRAGQLVIVSGYTGGGKTLFLESLTKDFEQQSEMPTWFSYELAPAELFDRFGKNLPLFILPSYMENGKDWLKEKITEAVDKYESKIIFVDHLHFIVDMLGVGQINKSYEIGQIMRMIKLIALELKVCIFLVAHTTKPKGFDGDVLELGSVRDSSFIEQEADTVLYIWRSNNHENGSFLKIAKDRKNGTWNKTIKLTKSFGVLKEYNVYNLE